MLYALRILAIYIFAAWLFMGLSPAQSLGNPELVMTAPPVLCCRR